MAAGSHVLADLVIVLGVAALTTVLFHALRQPVALGYVLAGLIIGPHVPVPLVANVALVSTLSELGVILLMFSIGLEFNIRKIARVGAPAALTAVIEVGLLIALGYLTGRLLGWSQTASLFTGACLGISSTMLVARAFAEQGLRDALTEMVFAILVFEDMIAILLLAVLTAVSSGSGLSTGELAVMIAKLAGFLAAMLVGGLLVVPRVVRRLAAPGRPETLLIGSLGICFGMALLAERAGYSVALGAFLAGMLVSESGRGADVEHLVHPFRDVFAAVFFVSVGMSIDPQMIVRHWLPGAVLTLVVVAGKLTGVSVGAFLAGSSLRRSVRAGMSLAQIGELSFIIAGLGVSTGVVGPELLAIMVGVSCTTALATPWLIRFSDPVSAWLDAALPRRVQTFVSFYGSWIEQIRAAPRRQTLWTRLRGDVLFLAVDAVLLGATVIGASVLLDRTMRFVSARLGITAVVVHWSLVAAAAAVAGIFLVGMLRCARRLARSLAGEALPPSESGKLDLGTAPRRALLITLELAIVLVVGLPLLVVTQPFVPTGLLVFGAVVLMLGFSAWRSLANLHGHVRAGSELIVEALSRQRRAPTEPAAPAATPELDAVREMLPGIPGLIPVRLAAGAPAVGRTLGELNLRAITGASALAIQRGEQGTVLPTAAEVLREGDVLALAGPDDAIAAARELLAGAEAGADADASATAQP